MCCCCCFCFFKQKTAYEMRISDWSSDVCSSDLLVEERLVLTGGDQANGPDAAMPKRIDDRQQFQRFGTRSGNDGNGRQHFLNGSANPLKSLGCSSLTISGSFVNAHLQAPLLYLPY